MKNKKEEKRKSVAVAMSGGVDSSVAAALLKKQGFDVVGIFMRLNDFSKESEKRAKKVAQILNIPFYAFNFKKEFKKRVVDCFLDQYKKGTTPNPCIVCNKEIKFGLLLKKAMAMGFDYLATGHYVKNINIKDVKIKNNNLNNISFNNVNAKNANANKVNLKNVNANNVNANNVNNLKIDQSQKSAIAENYDRGIIGAGIIEGRRLLRAKDKNKDQSYFLWQLDQKQLSRALFPLGNYTKEQVKKLAKKFNLPVVGIAESQEICFIQDSLNSFLKKHLKTKPGKIINDKGKILGKHSGLWFYTIGQRKGIELSGGPFYAAGKDFKNNHLIIAHLFGDNILYQKSLIAKNINWTFGKEPILPLKVKAQIRYGHKPVSVMVFKSQSGRTCKVIFSRAQRALTPGQSIVFYKGQELLGGGIIY